MANPNIERVYELLGAYLQGDETRLRDSIHPQGEVYGAPGLVNAGTYYGYEGFQRWIRQWEEAWADIRYELGEITEIDESVLVVPVHVVGRGAGSGIEIDTVFGWLYEWIDGRIRRFHAYVTVEDATEAAERLVAGQA